MTNATLSAEPIRAVPTDLTDLIIGGLTLHGELSADRYTGLADLRGHDVNAQAQAVLDMIRAGLASVQRDATGGVIRATPALRDHPRRDLTRAILIFVATARAGGQTDG